MQSSGRTLNSASVGCANCPEPSTGRQKMRAKIGLLLSASLLTGTTAAAAQPLPCASVAPEVRERVREAGACRDAAPGDAAPKASAPAASGAVTMKLSDGTVVRIPREISSNINDGRKRTPTNETAPPKSAARASQPAHSKPVASAGPSSTLQKLKVPDVIGRSYADADSALANFKVERIETASAAAAGAVLAQEPVPGTPVLGGSTIRVQVSDGSLAGAAGAIIDTAPATAVAPPSAPEAPAADPAVASATSPAPASEPTVQPAPRGRFPIAFSANAALILGAGVLLGLLLGALLMRQWQLRRMLAADANPALPAALYQHQQPVETTLRTEAMPEIRFAARLDPGETTIEFAPLVDNEADAIEQSSGQHA